MPIAALDQLGYILDAQHEGFIEGCRLHSPFRFFCSGTRIVGVVTSRAGQVVQAVVA